MKETVTDRRKRVTLETFRRMSELTVKMNGLSIDAETHLERCFENNKAKNEGRELPWK